MRLLRVKTSSARSGVLRQITLRTAILAAAVVSLPVAAASASTARAAGAAPASLTIGYQEAFHTLDPDRTTFQATTDVIALTVGTLVNYNADLTGVVPGLASRWRASRNGLRYTFTLRRGLTFSDGRSLTASDVVASFLRQMHDKANVNAGAFAQWKRVAAPNTRTVVISLREPQPTLLMSLAVSQNGAVYPASDLKSPTKFFQHPISDGQYVVQSFSPVNGNSTLALNPHYYGAKPAVSRLQFSFVNDVTTRILELKSGKLDYAENLPPNTLPQLTGAATSQLTPAFGDWFLYMNNRTGPLADSNVRHAISLAINRQQLNRVVFLGKGTPLYSFWATTFIQYHSNTLPTGVNLAQAKALLKGTPCASGCTIPIMVRSGNPEFQDMASIVSSNLAQIGITAPLQLTDSSTASTNESKGTFSMEVNGLFGSDSTPETMLIYGLQSNGGINALFSGYSSPQADKLIARALTTGGSASAALCRQIDRLFAKDLPYAPLLNWVLVNGERKAASRWLKMLPSGTFLVTSAR